MLDTRFESVILYITTKGDYHEHSNTTNQQKRPS